MRRISPSRLFHSPLLALVLALLLAFLALRLRERPHAAARTTAAPTVPAASIAQSLPAPPRSDLGPDERNNIAIYRRTSPSVVSVANKALVRAGFFSFQVFEVPQGAGSGFVWDRKGHIISNYHVIHEADALSVTFPDGKSYDARVVGAAPDYDLAVLRIEAPTAQLQPVTPGVSRVLQVGQTVLAIGNPYGLDASLSVGIISALGRSITSMTEGRIHDVIQTDAAINPGNSGGPLLDSSGRLIGINTAILSPSGAYAGIGFAVPVDTISRVVPQLIEHGRLIHASLGVQWLSDDIAQQVGVRGAVILIAPPGSPAARAGIEGISRTRRGDLSLGDVVVGIDTVPVTNLDDLRTQLERRQPGTTVRLQVERAGKSRAVNVRLVEGD